MNKKISPKTELFGKFGLMTSNMLQKHNRLGGSIEGGFKKH